MQTLERFIEKHRLTADVQPASDNPNTTDSWGHDAHHWTVTITRHNDGDEAGFFGATESMRVPFSQGSALTDPPTLADVLDCLASDASGYEDARNFEDWATSYGYDPDSRAAEKVYNAVAEQSKQLRNLLGQAGYDALVWKVERL